MLNGTFFALDNVAPVAAAVLDNRWCTLRFNVSRPMFFPSAYNIELMTTKNDFPNSFFRVHRSIILILFDRCVIIVIQN